jgi:hypothetical protein
MQWIITWAIHFCRFICTKWRFAVGYFYCSVHLFTNYNYCLQMILVSITYCGYTVAVVVSIAGSVTAEQESMFELASICFLCLLILKYICVLLLGSAMNKGLQLLTIFESTRWHLILHDSTCCLSPTPEVYLTLWIYLRVVKTHWRKCPWLDLSSILSLRMSSLSCQFVCSTNRKWKS